MAAETKTKKDEVVDRFETYEDYLDTFITEDDMIYLGEEEIARIVVELGYRDDKSWWRANIKMFYYNRSSATLTREKFFQTKAELAAARNISGKQEVRLSQADSSEDRTETPGEVRPDRLLQAIRERFPTNLDNSLNTILFLSRAPDDGQEV